MTTLVCQHENVPLKDKRNYASCDFLLNHSAVGAVRQLVRIAGMFNPCFAKGVGEHLSYAIPRLIASPAYQLYVAK